MSHHGYSYNLGNNLDYKTLTQTDFIFIKNVDSRWRDMDAIGHINNATYLTYFETARVDFLKQLELEVNDLDYGIEAPPSFGDTIDREKLSERRMIEVKEILEEFKSKREDLKEFEEELKKNKDKLTPGQIGES